MSRPARFTHQYNTGSVGTVLVNVEPCQHVYRNQKHVYRCQNLCLFGNHPIVPRPIGPRHHWSHNIFDVPLAPRLINSTIYFASHWSHVSLVPWWESEWTNETWNQRDMWQTVGFMRRGTSETWDAKYIVGPMGRGTIGVFLFFVPSHIASQKL